MPASDSANWQIRQGMTVVDLAGDRIGTVREVVGERPTPVGGRDPAPVGRNQEARRAGEGFSGYITVDHTGGPLYLPFTLVNRVSEDRVELAADADALDTLTWGRRPDSG
jgi:hypothetical protein